MKKLARQGAKEDRKEENSATEVFFACAFSLLAPLREISSMPIQRRTTIRICRGMRAGIHRL
jgi:hypothetical protein